MFDSGVGGLSVLQHIRRRLPRESLIYLADTACMPYGEKPLHALRERVLEVGERLLATPAKLLVVACNTATAAGIDALRQRHPGVPIVGMEPGVKPALTESLNHRVGILATTATLNSPRYRELVGRHAGDRAVIAQPCPGLVEQVEAGLLHHSATDALLHRYLKPLLDQGVDTLVLGCTHYPFLLDRIHAIGGEQLRIIDTGEAVARQVQRVLDQHALLNPGTTRITERYFTSAVPDTQSRIFRQLLGREPRLEAF